MANVTIPQIPVTAALTADADLVEISQGGVSMQAALSLLRFMTPGGRLTLQSGKPVMTADQVATANVYYAAHAHSCLPIAGSFFLIPSNQIQLILDSTNHLSGNLYDVAAINIAGVPTLVTGPAWSSSSSRGSGAGTAEIEQGPNGLWRNKVSWAHSWNNGVDKGAVAAGAAAILGTIYATANGQTGCAFNPAAAASGSNNIIGLFNHYNRVRVTATMLSTDGNYTYSTAAWRAANASNGYRISWVDGLGAIFAKGHVSANLFNGNAASGNLIGIAFNSTSAPVGFVGNNSSTQNFTCASAGTAPPVLGFNFAQAVERADGGTAFSLAWSNAYSTGQGQGALIAELEM